MEERGGMSVLVLSRDTLLVGWSWMTVWWRESGGVAQA